MRGQPRLAFEALDQPRLLAADVSAGAAMHVNVEGEIFAQDILAEQVVGVKLGRSLFAGCETLCRIRNADKYTRHLARVA